MTIVCMLEYMFLFPQDSDYNIYVRVYNYVFFG